MAINTRERERANRALVVRTFGSAFVGSMGAYIAGEFIEHKTDFKDELLLGLDLSEVAMFVALFVAGFFGFQWGAKRYDQIR